MFANDTEESQFLPRSKVMRGDYKEVLIHAIAALINIARTGLSRNITTHEIHMALTSPQMRFL